LRPRGEAGPISGKLFYKATLKILLLDQAFYPDVVSVAQHAADLAAALADGGHEVTVVASRRAYDSPSQTFPQSEVWRGVRVFRVRSTGFGKGAHWRRALDILSFYLFCTMRLALLPRFDVVVAMTVPPLISFVAALYVRIKGGSLISWVMDLNPDEAVAAGALREGSLLVRGLSRVLQFSLSSSAAVVVLDRFMRDRVAAKGIPQKRIFVLPPWAHDSVVRYDEDARQRFRAENGLSGKFVVMYSGNHSPCHPLDTLLEAARQMAEDPSVVFLFVGGGSQFPRVREFALRNSLAQVICLPYQPLEALAGSLSAADLHVVLMGDKLVGTVHPCKIYNILATGRPYLYVGPSPNHITDLARAASSDSAYFANHGETDVVISNIRKAAALGPRRCPAHEELAQKFSGTAIIPRLISVIEHSVEIASPDEGAEIAAQCAERSSQPPAV
jgi:glycosyltransferase involved in cell wall biosynthesis